MFLIRYYDQEEGETYLRLSPMPTEVEYPEGDLLNVQTTPDNNVVFQRPLMDSRPRRWVWKRYRPSITAYENQFQLLKSLTAKARQRDGHTELTVGVWEDESDEGGFGELLPDSGDEPDMENYTNLKFTTVRVANVYRKTAKGGGPVVYDDSVMEFYIEDDSFDAF